MRRLLGVVATVLGAGLLIGMVAMGSLPRAVRGQDVIDAARPEAHGDGLRALRNDADVVTETTAQTFDVAFPALASALGMSDAQFQRLLETRYPTVAAAVANRAQLLRAIDGVATNLEAHEDDFDAADSLPTSWLPLWAIPLGLGLAAVGLVAGGVALLRSSRRLGTVVTGVVAAHLVVLPLVTRMPQKSAQAEDLLGSLKVAEADIARTRNQFDTVQAAVDEISERLLPDAAAALGVDPADLVAELQRTVFGGEDTTARLAPALANIDGDVRFREQFGDDIRDVRQLPLSAMAWSLVGLGSLLVVLAVGAGLALRPGRAGVGELTPAAPAAAGLGR
jgi:hypothetical protein